MKKILNIPAWGIFIIGLIFIGSLVCYFEILDILNNNTNGLKVLEIKSTVLRNIFLAIIALGGGCVAIWRGRIAWQEHLHAKEELKHKVAEHKHQKATKMYDRLSEYVEIFLYPKYSEDDDMEQVYSKQEVGISGIHMITLFAIQDNHEKLFTTCINTFISLHNYINNSYNTDEEQKNVYIYFMEILKPIIHDKQITIFLNNESNTYSKRMRREFDLVKELTVSETSQKD